MVLEKERKKKTRIVCTIGPASEDKKVLTKLVQAGMNVMRLNFSHGDFEEHGGRIKTLREINKELNKNVAILLDTKGPEIRTGDFVDGKTEFKKGQVSTICVEDIVGTSEKFTITYKDLYKDVKPGGFILVNDGQVELLVDHIDGTDIVCVAANDGDVKNKRGINVPGIKLGFDYLSPKDISDLTFGAHQPFDYVAASFCRRAQDIIDIKKLLIENGRNDIQILAKIENQEGVENVGKQYMNTAAVAALEARVKLYMKNYEGAITAAQEAITLSGGTIVSTKEDYKNMYTTLAVSTEDIFFIAKAEDDYLSANALNTLWNKYGLSINSATVAEYSPNDIRLALLGGTWTGGKMRGITTNNQISNLPVFRLPEMYLIQAEAYAKQSTPDYGKAKEKLLEVAAKRNPDLDDSEIAEDQTIIDVIDKERKLELVQEGHRFFDARRLGKIISVADGAYTNFNIAKFVYPIPSFEVNSGFGVIQTEGWSNNLPR